MKCDQNDFTVGWYRFTGAAGDRMASTCPKMHHCSTHAPGWMSETHPTVAEGVVTRKVCYHWTSGCCEWSNYIRVKNCGSFYVYELQKTPLCSISSRYCGECGRTCMVMTNIDGTKVHSICCEITKMTDRIACRSFSPHFVARFVPMTTCEL